MKLFKAKIPVIARDLLDQLTADHDLELNDRQEAELDIQSVLNEYLRLERDLTDRAKDMLEARSLSFGQFGRVKRTLAEQSGVGSGDEPIVWMCNQILETFMQSPAVDEVFREDSELRSKMKVIIRRHMLVDEELDQEVRDRIKNLQEGGASWDVEYARVMDQIRHKRGLDKA
ncbi:MAG: DUF507 family protein [Proteobacteria bacterium]|nr:DUF507 family protein [Pseudomonadota bacterium]